MLNVTCGPMFAGKSTAIIKDSLDLKPQQKLVIKPKTDTRNENYITSHSGILIPAVEIDPDHSSIIGMLFSNEEITDIFIDEIQFFKPWIVREIKAILFTYPREINVHVYGLDLDYKLEPWPIMQQLLPLANKVTKLTAKCSYCDWPASKTIRSTNLEDKLILIGQGDHYEPRCNRHTV